MVNATDKTHFLNQTDDGAHRGGFASRFHALLAQTLVQRDGAELCDGRLGLAEKRESESEEINS